VEIVFERRYRGPQTSANGGYAAGSLASVVDAPEVEVTLRLPPPLERPLAVQHDGAGSTVLLDGDAVVAEARAAPVDVDAPEPVSLGAAAEASERSSTSWPVEFRECFVCGLRAEHDGLGIRVGPVESRAGLHAAPWTATEVATPVVWAAIDCPGAYAVGAEGRGEVVLGRMTARIERSPEDGEQCVVVSWPLGEDGRKLFAGTALFAADGELLAIARQTWIVPRASAE
jgi:hypothetical protein